MTDKEIIQIFSDKRGKINPNKTRATWLDKNPQIKTYLENRYSVFFDYVTTLQFIFNGLDEPPKCENCGKTFDCTDNYDRIENIQICDLTGKKFQGLGYHSVHAHANTASYIRRDEVIVYDKAQVACRYLVEIA